jgi:hypothetical protein
MQLNYFEEFPEKVTDSQLELASGKTVFIAAKSYPEFLKIEQDFLTRNRAVECAYWPLVKSSYWVSPFAKKSDLELLLSEIKKDNGAHKILVDLEFPFFRLHRFLLGLWGYRAKKELIANMVNGFENIYTTENPASTRFTDALKKKIGMSFQNKHRIIMCYLCSPLNLLMRKANLDYLKSLVEKDEKVVIGLGTNSAGPYGLGFPSTKQKIRHDAEVFRKELGVDEFYIYQLSGEKIKD